MTRLENTAETGQPDGTTVSTANSAAPDAFDLVTIGSGNTLTYESVAAFHGALGIRAGLSAANTAYARLGAMTGGMSAETASFRFYARWSINPANNLTFCRLMTSTSVSAVQLRVNTTGTVSLANTASTAVSTSPVLSPGVWYRFEVWATRGTTTTDGHAGFEVYVGDNMAPLHTYSATNINTGTATLKSLELGRSGGTTAMWLDLDDAVLDDALGETFVGASGVSTGRLRFQGTYVDAVDRTAYTFAAAPLGQEGPTRRVIVAVSTNSTRTFSSVTIAGVTATVDVAQNVPGTATVAMYSAVVPTGLTGDIVVTCDALALGIGMAVWTLPDGGDPTGQTANGSGDPTSLSLTTAVGDEVVAYTFAIMSVASGSFQWTGGTERFDQDVYSTTTSHSGVDATATGTTTAFSASSANATTVGIAAAYGMPAAPPTAHDAAGVVAVSTDAIGAVSLITPVVHSVSGTVAVGVTVSGAATVIGVPVGTTHVIEYVAWDYDLLAGG